MTVTYPRCNILYNCVRVPVILAVMNLAVMESPSAALGLCSTDTEEAWVGGHQWVISGLVALGCRSSSWPGGGTEADCHSVASANSLNGFRPGQPTSEFVARGYRALGGAGGGA
jgi:hypothetical protein